MVGEGRRLNLTGYNSIDPIFVDANIVLDYSMPNRKYGHSVLNFFDRIELGEISAVTTSAVLGEVAYALLMYKGGSFLGTHDHNIIGNAIKRDAALASQCYAAVDKLNETINALKGLNVISVTWEDYAQVPILGKKYRLLPTDALHLSAMKNNSIKNIATRDSDFERVEGIEIWSP